MKYVMKDPKSFFSNVFSKHPGLALSPVKRMEKEYRTVHYRFKKKLVGLMFNQLRPDTENIFDVSSWMKLIKSALAG